MMRLQQLRFVGVLVLAIAPTGISQVVLYRPPDNAGPTVKLNLRGNVELGALVEYVGKRLNVSFVYDDEVAGKKVNVRAPEEVPVSSLLDLLGSVLKMEGLILVESDTPGWLRIVDSSEMARLARPEPGAGIRNPATPVTQLFVLESTDPQELLPLLRPFLTQPGGNSVALSETGTLIITDYASVVDNAATLIKMLDKGRGETMIRYYRVKHADVEGLVTKVNEALNATTSVKIIGIAETQVVAIVGVQPQLDQAIEFLERFDVPVDRSVKVHRFKNIRAERVQAILEGMLEGETWARYTVTADRDANLLVIRATADVHEIFDKIIHELDQPTENPSTPLRFYKLQNAKAIEVFFTLQALQQLTLTGGGLAGGGLAGGGLPGGGLAPFGNPYASGLYGGRGTAGVLGGFGPFATGVPGSTGVPINQFGTPGFGIGTMGLRSDQRPLETTALPLTNQTDDTLSPQDTSRERVGQLSAAAMSQLSAATGTATLPGGARVSVDIASNSLIVVAPNEIHRMYEKIIKKLDVRRPQVLIEVHIVAIDTSDRFQLGVEVSGGDRVGDRRLFKFTSFGLSEVDPANGTLSLNPSLGFNGALVDPSVADVIIQALVTHTRARVLSSPQILVNDNSTGQLESTASVPFQSVNASNTVSTTSLGGNQDAGTKITVTPQINEGDHLHLDFALEFSTFEGEGPSASLPPPRQIDRVSSQVTIPNGHTVIVGGLNRSSEQDSFSGVPWLERIPVIRELSSLRNEQNDSTSFFLFIRPNILRDDKFRDLKHFSRRSLRKSGASGEYPASQPIMMK